MDHDLRADDGQTELQLVRVDAGVTDLLRSVDSALARAVRHVIDHLGETGNYAAHSSSPVP